MCARKEISTGFMLLKEQNRKDNKLNLCQPNMLRLSELCNCRKLRTLVSMVTSPTIVTVVKE
jgi:hypothetical protein